MKPAILGGIPTFQERLALGRPTIEDAGIIESRIKGVLDSGYLTDGPLTRQLEERVADAFDVEHCIAVSSCTMGLLLVIQALELDGPVLIPSFTFVASANAAAWNGLPITFADCSPDTWCLRPEDVVGQPTAILGVHVSGVPCDVVGLERAAADLGAQLLFDAAHGSGSLTTIEGRSRPLGGFGRAEVFSLTPTKVMNGAEGGLITTNDPDLAERLRIARNYGNPGDYNTLFPGLNARLSELHAAVALSSLDHLEDRVVRRNELAHLYENLLGPVPGVKFQTVPEGSRSCHKDYTILIDEDLYGCDRDSVAAALAADGVDTRKYYSPPVHRQQAFANGQIEHLPVTDRLASQVLTLPMWSHLSNEAVEGVSETLVRIHEHADHVQAAAQVSA